MARIYHFHWKPGSDAALARLGRDGAIVTKTYANDHHLKVGSRFTCSRRPATTNHLVVRGVQKPPEFDPLGLGKIQIAQAAYDKLFTNHRVRYVFADVDGVRRTH